VAVEEEKKRRVKKRPKTCDDVDVVEDLLLALLLALPSPLRGREHFRAEKRIFASC